MSAAQDNVTTELCSIACKNYKYFAWRTRGGTASAGTRTGISEEKRTGGSGLGRAPVRRRGIGGVGHAGVWSKFVDDPCRCSFPTRQAWSGGLW